MPTAFIPLLFMGLGGLEEVGDGLLFFCNILKYGCDSMVCFGFDSVVVGAGLACGKAFQAVWFGGCGIGET